MEESKKIKVITKRSTNNYDSEVETSIHSNRIKNKANSKKKRETSSASKHKNRQGQPILKKVSNHSLMDTLLKNENDSRFKCDKNKAKKSVKLNESVNKSFKSESSSKSILKNNLKNVNEYKSIKPDSQNNKVKNELNSKCKTNQKEIDNIKNKKTTIDLKNINFSKDKKNLIKEPNSQKKIVDLKTNIKDISKNSKQNLNTNSNNTFISNKDITINQIKNKTLNRNNNENNNLSPSNSINKKIILKNIVKDTQVKFILRQVKSKIKTIIEKDKKIYNILKKNNYENELIQVYANEKTKSNNNMSDKDSSFLPEEKNRGSNDKNNNLFESDVSNINLNYDKSILLTEKKESKVMDLEKTLDIKQLEPKSKDNIIYKEKPKSLNSLEMTVKNKDINKDNKTFNIANKELLHKKNPTSHLENFNQNNISESVISYNYTKNDDSIEDNYLNNYNKMNLNPATDNINYSSNNESVESINHYNNELEKKVNRDISSSSTTKYDINRKYSNNIQKLKYDMNLSDDEENTSTKDKNPLEKYLSN